MTAGILAKDLPVFQEPVIPPRIIPDKTPKIPLTEEELAAIEEEAQAKIAQAKKEKAERNRKQRNTFLAHELKSRGFTPTTSRPSSAVPNLDVESSSGMLQLPPLDSARSENGKKLTAPVSRKPRRKPSMSAPSSPRGRPRGTPMDVLASSSGGLGGKHHKVVVEALEEEALRQAGAGKDKRRTISPTGSRAGSVAGSHVGSRAGSPRSQNGASITPAGGSLGFIDVNDDAVKENLQDSQKSIDSNHDLKNMNKSGKMPRTINNRRSFA